MAPGIILIIVGGIFAFAVRAESSWLDVQTVGLILILGGAAFIARSRMRRTVVVTRETEDLSAPEQAGRTETEQTTVVERTVE
jgi:hypothetical protein